MYDIHRKFVWVDFRTGMILGCLHSTGNRVLRLDCVQRWFDESQGVELDAIISLFTCQSTFLFSSFFLKKNSRMLFVM